MVETPAGMRLDKWLWHARFFKTRTLCARLVNSGGLRLNAAPVRRAAEQVRPGDTLTFARGREILVIRVLAIGTRRGPAAEAALLYQDLTERPAARSPDHRAAAETVGRPDRRDRRAILKWKDELAGGSPERLDAAGQS